MPLPQSAKLAARSEKNLKQTEAAVLFEPNQPLRLLSLSLPDLRPGQVLVEVAYSGVCQSQLLEVLGKRGPDPYLPHTLGHEGSGTVVAISEGVTKVKPGERVVLSWIKGMGAEVGSTAYQSEEGVIHSGAISTFLRLAVVSENRLIPIPDKMPLREAAMLGCAIPTGVGIVRNTAKVKPGSSVAIFGVGGIGLSAVIGCQLAQANQIIAIDITEEKLNLAKKLGATHLINSKKENAKEAVLKVTQEKGVDYAIECAGKRETMEAAFECVRPNGGLCILAGNLSQGEKISIDPFSLIQGKKIVGTWGGETVPDRDIPFYVDQYLTGRLKLDALITHEYPLKAVNSALNDLREGKVGRAVINLKA